MPGLDLVIFAVIFAPLRIHACLVANIMTETGEFITNVLTSLVTMPSPYDWKGAQCMSPSWQPSFTVLLRISNTLMCSNPPSGMGGGGGSGSGGGEMSRSRKVSYF